jgi:hypothetical protein
MSNITVKNIVSVSYSDILTALNAHDDVHVSVIVYPQVIHKYVFPQVQIQNEHLVSMVYLSHFIDNEYIDYYF